MTTLEKLEELVYHGFKETDRKFEETDRRFRETDRKFEETDRRFRETDRILKEQAQERKDADEILRQQLAGLTKSLGLFAESMVLPSVTYLFGKRGFVLSQVASRLEARRNGGTMEIDVLGAGSDSVIAIEAKLRLDVAGVKEFLQRLPHFFEFFPRYSGLKLYGAVAGMSVDRNAPRYAYKQGLFVLAPCGENMQILNDKEFVPREFGKAKSRKS